MQQGTRLGPYEILERLGAGGMGEVYLANDPRLGRRVAVKVLPPEFAGDAERLARFEQEARAAAALSHANIAVVHDVGAHEGVHYFVQEFLSGSELRDRLDASPPDTSGAVEIAVQIARALEVAHRAGVVHRDLKPENVFVTADDTIKVLDFGLAKLVEPPTGEPGLTDESPTQLGTSAGVIMGTAGYMAPEQVQGGDIDGRTDIFAFGCVLYEMLTHARPFQGESVIQTLNRIVHEEPRPIGELAAVSPELRRIVGKCLAKNPRHRYQTASDLVVDLEALASDPASLEPPQPSVIEAAAPRSAAIGFQGAALAVLALVAGAAGAWFFGQTEAPEELVVRSDLVVTLSPRNDPVVAVAPDGTRVAYLGQTEVGEAGIYVRDLASNEAQLVVDTGFPHSPFFSPDGGSIGYFEDTDRSLRVVNIATGDQRRMAPTTSAHLGATWTHADTLVFTGYDGGIGVVAAAGGEPRMLALPDDEGLGYENPRPIHGTGDVLVTIRDATGAVETFSVGIMDGQSGEVREILSPGSDARYVEPGYLLFRAREGLAAVPFDLPSQSVTGQAFSVIDGVHVTADGPLEYDAAGGLLLYVDAADYPLRQEFTIVAADRSGNTTPLPVPPAPYWGIRVSPDGRRLSVDIGSPTYQRPSTMLFDLVTATSATLDAQAWYSAWSNDGLWLAVGRQLVSGSFEVALLATDLSGRERILPGPTAGWTPQPIDFMPGDESLLVDQITNGTVWEVATEPGGSLRPLDITALRLGTALSPDGRWIAYSAQDGGEQRLQIIERETGRRWIAGTGVYPRWAHDGTALYYWTDDVLWTVPVAVDSADWEAGDPVRLFEGVYVIGDDERSSWDLSPDGETFYLIRDDQALVRDGETAGWPPVRMDLVQNAGALITAIDPAADR